MDIYEWGIDICEWGMSLMRESCQTWMTHMSHMNVTYEWHICLMRNLTYMSYKKVIYTFICDVHIHMWHEIWYVCHTWMWHMNDTYVKYESCHICHIWIWHTHTRSRSLVKHGWLICHTWMWHMNDTYVSYEIWHICHIWMRFTHSYVTYTFICDVKSDIYVAYECLCRIWMIIHMWHTHMRSRRRVKHERLICHMYHIWMRYIIDEWVIREWLLWRRKHAYKGVMSYINESCHIWMSHVTYKWVVSHMNESCHI